MEIRDRVALITGAARVGLAVVQALAARGCHVAVTYRSSRAAAEEALSAAAAAGVEGHAIAADLSRAEDAARAVAETDARFGRLDILVNMASVYRRRPIEELTEQDWRDNLEVDLGSAYRLARAAAPLMRRQGEGRIVNFADWLPVSGRPRYKGYLPYYVAKAGVVGLTEALALELAPQVLVNAVAPGPILPPPEMSAEEAERIARNAPLGRWGGATEVARATLFLIETEFVTGECIRVDGGRHLN